LKRVEAYGRVYKRLQSRESDVYPQAKPRAASGDPQVFVPSDIKTQRLKIGSGHGGGHYSSSAASNVEFAFFPEIRGQIFDQKMEPLSPNLNRHRLKIPQWESVFFSKNGSKHP